MKPVALLILIPILIVGGIILFGKSSQNEVPKVKAPVVPAKIITDNPVLIKKSLSDVNALIEIPDKDKAKVMQIGDLKVLQTKHELFKKAFKDDLIILLPDKTIIYDPLTKTIRDISNESFYDSF